MADNRLTRVNRSSKPKVHIPSVRRQCRCHSGPNWLRNQVDWRLAYCRVAALARDCLSRLDRPGEHGGEFAHADRLHRRHARDRGQAQKLAHLLQRPSSTIAVEALSILRDEFCPSGNRSNRALAIDQRPAALACQSMMDRPEASIDLQRAHDPLPVRRGGSAAAARVALGQNRCSAAGPSACQPCPPCFSRFRPESPASATALQKRLEIEPRAADEDRPRGAKVPSAPVPRPRSASAPSNRLGRMHMPVERCGARASSRLRPAAPSARAGSE
jgi:hypothetical protein